MNQSPKTTFADVLLAIAIGLALSFVSFDYFDILVK